MTESAGASPLCAADYIGLKLCWLDGTEMAAAPGQVWVVPHELSGGLPVPMLTPAT